MRGVVPCCLARVLVLDSTSCGNVDVFKYLPVVGTRLGSNHILTGLDRFRVQGLDREHAICVLEVLDRGG